MRLWRRDLVAHIANARARVPVAPRARRARLARRFVREKDVVVWGHALGVIEMTKREIEVRRLFHEWYGYEFFVARSIE